MNPRAASRRLHHQLLRKLENPHTKHKKQFHPHWFLVVSRIYIIAPITFFQERGLRRRFTCPVASKWPPHRLSFRALHWGSSIDPLEALRPDPFLGPDEAEAGDAPDVPARTGRMTHQAKAQMRSRLDLPRRARALRVLAGTGIRLVLQLPLSLARPFFVVPPRLRASPTILSAFFGHLLSLFLSFVEDPKDFLSISQSVPLGASHPVLHLTGGALLLSYMRQIVLPGSLTLTNQQLAKTNCFLHGGF